MGQTGQRAAVPANEGQEEHGYGGCCVVGGVPGQDWRGLTSQGQLQASGILGVLLRGLDPPTVVPGGHHTDSHLPVCPQDTQELLFLNKSEDVVIYLETAAAEGSWVPTHCTVSLPNSNILY